MVSPRPAQSGSASERRDTLPEGVLTEEFVSTPYGVGRLILPHVPRTDGIVVVRLQDWGATAYLAESEVARLDDYKPSREEEKAKTTVAAAGVRSPAASAASSSGSPSSSSTSPPSASSGKSKSSSSSSSAISWPHFAPLNTPLYRRRQTLALTIASFWSLVCAFAALLCIRAQGVVFYLFLAYVAYMILFQNYHRDGKGLKWNAWRRIAWWKWFRDYFPISLHATTPLDPTGRYVFCYHPHGILSLGAFLNFGTEATGFAEKFPGIDLRLMTLTSNFRIPFYGIFLSMMGIADASRDSCNRCLQRCPGSAILLVLGGAKESLDAHPHRDYELTLHRKGFVKVALENHADLVPVFSFGENDVWDQVENPRGSLLRDIQERLQQKLGFAFPLVKGRGLLQYNFGLLPFRRPINTFVGPPLILPKVNKADITDEMIDEYHEKYKVALATLFNRYKGTFAPHRKLIFVEAYDRSIRGSKRPAQKNQAGEAPAQAPAQETSDNIESTHADAAHGGDKSPKSPSKAASTLSKRR